MGFRDPLTTASETDTGQTVTGPGARLYQEPGDYYAGTWPKGVLEFRSGLAGDTPGRVELESFVYQDGPGPDATVQSFGNAFRLLGGGTNGVAPSGLEFRIEETPLGDYAASGRLVGVPVLHGPTGPVANARGLGFFTNPNLFDEYSNYAPNGNFGVVELYKDATGTVHLEGIVRNKLALAANAAVIVGTVPLAFRPRKTILLEGMLNNALCRLDVYQPTGNVSLIINASSTVNGGLVLNGEWLAQDL